MAAVRSPSASFLSAFLPVVRSELFPQIPQRSQSITKRLPLLQRLRNQINLSPLLPSALTPIPSLLGDLWDGLLNAVPKKKTSHMKKRHRQMAGKGLKDVTALNKCSACGRAKRAHVLCPYCVQSIKRWFGNGFKTQAQVEAEERQMLERYNEELRIRKWGPQIEPKKKDEEKSVK
ncbi:hypothetical protein K431DRAFT_269978 [Polychaeton citri CBS 116435]|uniref:Large ribosomal subunit protein bL32m n=1 Tax=Polychaeton citri CBS 116435 TaxID=1314669 RepID=A0A9P4Q7P5_9PEZI|nr:hypothetical protein K431DRAFT_269978 [Polychaeton citri CBS 116435]